MYNPNKCNDLNTFFGQLRTISPALEDIIVCGDFNIKLFAMIFWRNGFVIMLRLVAYILLMSIHHDMPWTAIQHCLTQWCARINHKLSISIGGISDHELLFYVHDLDLHCESYECLSYHDLNATDIVALFNDCSTLIGMLHGIMQMLIMMSVGLTHRCPWVRNPSAVVDCVP